MSFPTTLGPEPQDTTMRTTQKIHVMLWDLANGTGAFPNGLPVDVNVSTSSEGAPNFATGQVAASGVASTLLAARATRRGATFKNLDSSITVYIGPATVTAGNGMQLKAGESISVDTRALVQVIAASGTPTVAYIETYD